MFKKVQIWVRKLAPKIVKNEIAGLRHFLPRRHFLGFFLADFCMAFWSSLGVSWAALGPLEVLLRGICSQKLKKNTSFLRFLNIVALGFLIHLRGLLASSWLLLGCFGLKMGSKVGSIFAQLWSKFCVKNVKKKCNFGYQFWSRHGLFLRSPA